MSRLASVAVEDHYAIDGRPVTRAQWIADGPSRLKTPLVCLGSYPEHLPHPSGRGKSCIRCGRRAL